MSNQPETGPSASYRAARKRLDTLKGFYRHLAVFVQLSLLIIFSEPFIQRVLSDKGIGNTGFLEWVHWNILLFPIIWGVVLLVQAAITYWHRLSPLVGRLKPGFVRRWEERQICKILQEAANRPTTHDPL